MYASMLSFVEIQSLLNQQYEKERNKQTNILIILHCLEPAPNVLFPNGHSLLCDLVSSYSVGF